MYGNSVSKFLSSFQNLNINNYKSSENIIKTDNKQQSGIIRNLSGGIKPKH